MPGRYVIRGGLERRERLRMLARVMGPTTEALLATVGIPTDARCLDSGCGGGDVTRSLARLSPSGCIVGVDFDEAKIRATDGTVMSVPRIVQSWGRRPD